VERGKLGLGQFPGAFPFFFPKEFWAKQLKIKTETADHKNTMLQHECKTCFYAYDKFYLFQKFI
jgi:hypothetical protein